MKRLYAALALILFLAVAVFTATRTVNNNYKYFSEMLNQCEQSFINGNAVEKCSEFEKEFEKRQKALCIFINRSVLDNISLYAARMTSAAEQNNAENFYSELASIRLNFYKLKDDENFSVVSLF